MRIYDFREEILNNCWRCYAVGFINDEGNVDETELVAYDMYELEELYDHFCEENGFAKDTVDYIETRDHVIHVEYDILVEDALAEDVKKFFKRNPTCEGILNVHNVVVSEDWLDATYIR